MMVAMNSILGLPWLVASTVPCIMHVMAMSDKAQDGTVLSIQESRLTGFFTHGLVACSIFALGIIKLIPMPVLYGVFLFMGLVALPAQQFWQRILLLFMEPKKYPSTPYTDYMQIKRVHLFTFIQAIFFALLYAVKSIKTIAIAFPLMILLCIPARIYLLPKFFSKDELILLDGSPERIEKWIAKREREDDREVWEQKQSLVEKGDSSTDEKDKDSSDDSVKDSILKGRLSPDGIELFHEKLDDSEQTA